MDQSQLRRQYEQDTSMMVNPPSFQSWLFAKRRRESYEQQRESTNQWMEKPDYDVRNDSYY